MLIKETIQVKNNLSLVCRERGKIIERRDGHNIWLDLGREYLAKLVALQSYGPDVPFTDARIKYFGFGIGGTRQLALATANAAPISPPYVGANTQTDDDPLILTVERPVRLSGSTTAYPGIVGDKWLGRITSADPTALPKQVTFRRVFTQMEVSYGPFVTVPLSEVALFTSDADPENYKNNPVAYDTFDTLSKTSAIDIEVVWTIYIT